MKKIITTLAVILAIIGFSFCLSSTVHADMMSPSNPASPTSPLNPDNMEQDEEDHENSNNQMPDKDEKLGIFIIGIFLVGVVFVLVFLIIQASW